MQGSRFTVKPKYTVLAVGGIENARLLLASNDVMQAGVGNGSDLVGRFFADHPIPAIPRQWSSSTARSHPITSNRSRRFGAYFRAALAPHDEFKRRHAVLCSLATIEGEVQLDGLGQAAVAATAAALGIDAGNMRAFTLGCGMELAPDPDRR